MLMLCCPVSCRYCGKWSKTVGSLLLGVMGLQDTHLTGWLGMIAKIDSNYEGGKEKKNSLLAEERENMTLSFFLTVGSYMHRSVVPRERVDCRQMVRFWPSPPTPRKIIEDRVRERNVTSYRKSVLLRPSNGGLIVCHTYILRHLSQLFFAQNSSSARTTRYHGTLLVQVYLQGFSYRMIVDKVRPHEYDFSTFSRC